MMLQTGNKGLTLIEVLLAVSILGIGLVSVLRAYAGSITTLEAGQFTIDGASLAKQKMAEVEQAIMEEEDIPKGRESGVFEPPFEEFLWEWDIKPSETKDLYTLSLVVSHQYNLRKFFLKTYVVDKESEEKEK
jgi:prepilin-type N-terminal cleavage/methylation domain-containing protein